MAGFFEERLRGLENGGGMLYDAFSRGIKQGFGWQEIPEASPGLAGWVVESVRAAIDGLFDKDKGLLRFDQGYKLNPWEAESVWNPFRHVRRAVSAVLNTGITATTKFVGIWSPSAGNFFSRMLQGLSTTILAPVLGDISPYIGPRQPSIYNDGSYKAANSDYYGQSAANSSDYTPAAAPAPTPPVVVENVVAETAPVPTEAIAKAA